MLFLREAFNYKNFDEKGKYIPRSKRKNKDFGKNFKVEKKDINTKENNTSKSNENVNSDTKEQSSTNDTPQVVIKLSDEQTLNMILKMTFLIMDFVRTALEDSEDNEE